MTDIEQIIDRLNNAMEQSPEGETCPILTRDEATAILTEFKQSVRDSALTELRVVILEYTSAMDALMAARVDFSRGQRIARMLTALEVKVKNIK